MSEKPPTRKLSLPDSSIKSPSPASQSEQEEKPGPRKGSVALSPGSDSHTRRLSVSPQSSEGGSQRRFSILNHLGIVKQPEREATLTEYEVVGSAFYLPPDFDKPDAKMHSQQLANFFSQQEPQMRPSSGKESGSSDGYDTGQQDAIDRHARFEDTDSDYGWISPESWSILPPPKTPSVKAYLVDNPECAEFWVIRVFRPEVRRLSRDFISSASLDNTSLMYVNVSGSLDTETSDLYPALARKFFGGSDIGRYRLFVQHSGLEVMLLDDSRPFLMQKRWFEEIGYQGREEINATVSHEHSYVCRFSLKDLPSASRPRLSSDPASSATFSADILSSKYALLGNMNLSVVPVDVFQRSETLETIDFSRNTLLNLPEDLFSRLCQLRLLVLRQNMLSAVPSAIFSAQSVTNLDLSSNRLNCESLRALRSLANLSVLNLTSNNVEEVPDDLAALTHLQSLILSSNYLRKIDPVLFRFGRLRELDISFNMIEKVPGEIKGLHDLQCFVVTGNALAEISSHIHSCARLKSLDIRGNLMQELSCLAQCSNLVDLRADYNFINSIESPEWPRMVDLSLSKNNICMVSWSTRMPHLRYLDLSGNRIGWLSDDFFMFCQAVEYINLSDNQLTALPSSLDSLQRLVKLVVANNQLAECGLKFEQLVKLKILDLHSNNLKRLPGELWWAPSLTILNLSSNFFVSLPQPPSQSHSNQRYPLELCLEELYMGENQCRNEIFIQLAQFKELRRLNLSMNDLFDFPNGMVGLERLTELYLSHNQLSSLPDDINMLSKLKVLCVNNNRLTTLPGELCECKDLEVLDASCNSLRFNVTNVPYDWNWKGNPELHYLSLADNPKLDINPPGQSTSLASELGHFRGMAKLCSLNLTNIKVKPESVPDESTSLRVRTTWSDIAGFKVGVAEFCGRRAKFDVFDFTVGRFSDDLNSSDCLFGVFDGKGSANVSSYLYQYFPANLHVAMNANKTSTEEALRLAFLSSNADLSTQPIELRAGSTATVLYMNEDNLHIANVGDTVAVLSREGRAIELTSRHYAWSRPETDRLRSLGGHITMNGLVEGEIELTRAIGYLHMLPYINASPSIRKVQMTDQDEFVVIGSGSLWKAISMQTAVDIVRKDPSDLTVAAQRIRDLALAYAVSLDNSLMVMVIGLKQRRLTDHQSSISLEPQLLLRRRKIREDIQDSTLARLPKEIDPPCGSLAMVFTDIRDSTVLWETLTAPMRVAKKMHHMIMRRTLRMIGGYEVKTEGDAFMVTFPTASKAIRWCLAVQLELLEADWPPELLRSPICASQYSSHSSSNSNNGGNKNSGRKLLYRGVSVRMGIHFGEMEGEQDMVTGRMDYNGVPVIIASRIQSHALGGQILVSEACKCQFQSEFGEHSDEDARIANHTLRAQFVDVGLLRLKGIEAMEHVFALYPEALADRYTGPPDAAIPVPPVRRESQ